MIQKFRFAFVALVLSVSLVSGSASAQTLSADRAHGLARYWMNLAGFAGQCIDEGLLDKSSTNIRYLKFGSYLGGYLIGALLADPGTVGSQAEALTKEGSSGRVHEFDKDGKLVAYDVEFTKENCAKLNELLKVSFETFSKLVLEE